MFCVRHEKSLALSLRARCDKNTIRKGNCELPYYYGDIVSQRHSLSNAPRDTYEPRPKPLPLSQKASLLHQNIY